jgi:hypothetical protein
VRALCQLLKANRFILLASRCLAGLLNGNVGVMKSMMAELTDSTNIAQGLIVPQEVVDQITKIPIVYQRICLDTCGIFNWVDDWVSELVFHPLENILKINIFQPIYRGHFGPPP